MLTSRTYARWHTAAEAYWFGREHAIHITHNCMLFFANLYVVRYRREILTMPDRSVFHSPEPHHFLARQCQTSRRPRVLEFRMTKPSGCLIVLHIHGFFLKRTRMRLPWPGNLLPTSTYPLPVNNDQLPPRRNGKTSHKWQLTTWGCLYSEAVLRFVNKMEDILGTDCMKLMLRPHRLIVYDLARSLYDLFFPRLNGTAE